MTRVYVWHPGHIKHRWFVAEVFMYLGQRIELKKCSKCGDIELVITKL
jgi:hypothetical protein